MNKLLIYAVLVFIFLFPSCDILRDSPYEVISWTPGDGYHGTENLVVSLLFSHSSNRIKTEQSFSLSEDGRPVKGTFYWNDCRLFFLPSSPLEDNRDYLITLGTGAQDERGLSLENKFLASFTTRPEGRRPSVIATEPSSGIISGLREKITIRFSEPVTINSCINNISFVPTVSGSWHLEEEGYIAVFQPLEPWKTGIKYRVNINSAFTSASGRSMGENYFFYINTIINGDPGKPVLLSVWAVSSDETNEITVNDTLDSDLAEYAEWDSSCKIRLNFSKPVDAWSVRQKLSTEPYASLVMETPPGFSSSVVFKFANELAWQSAYTFRLNTGVRDETGNETKNVSYFRIRTADERSRPPSLIGMRLPLEPGKSGFEEQRPQIFTPKDLYADLDIRYDEIYFPYGKAIEFWLELYFDTAPNTQVDLFSLMNLFRVEATNNALAFSPRHIECSEFTWLKPVEGWECYNRIEVRGFITNDVKSGVVTFRINSGLEDKRGNRSTDTFRISLLK